MDIIWGGILDGQTDEWMGNWGQCRIRSAVTSSVIISIFCLVIDMLEWMKILLVHLLVCSILSFTLGGAC